MAKDLLDLLWRQHPSAPSRGARGPEPARSVSAVVDAAVRLADGEGLGRVSMRRLGDCLSMSAMSLYTHVSSREDLLVLMADSVHDAMARPTYPSGAWHDRARRVADANLQLFMAHPWMLEINDPRLVLGPGTIAKYEHELHAFDGTSLSDVDRDAALTHVVNFAKSSAWNRIGMARGAGGFWPDSAPRLARYLGSDYPVAQRVGAAAGGEMGAPYSSDRQWEFGIELIIRGLGDVMRNLVPRRGGA